MNRLKAFPVLAASLTLVCASAFSVELGDPDVTITDGNLVVSKTGGSGGAAPSLIQVVNNFGTFTPMFEVKSNSTLVGGYPVRFRVGSPSSSFMIQAWGPNGQGALKNSGSLTGFGERTLIGAGPGGTLVLYAGDAYATGHIHVTPTGNMGVGVSSPTVKLDVAGEVKMTVANITGGSDLAERFEVKAVANTKVEPGMVVCIDPEKPGSLVLSSKPYDKTVVGIISGAGGLNTGMTMGQNNTIAEGGFPVALTGRVYCMVDATRDAIEPGDMLTTSATPGHAMKASDSSLLMGSVIGKAMTPMAKGEKGLVMVLVSLQ